jgi:pimeloyl-ACP methyl ester carboxylesterase
MPDPVRRVVTGPAGDLVVWDHPGGGPAVLLLHGIGNYGRVWDDVADAVGGRLRLVAPDARGHGDSFAPADGYAPADFVADAVTILDALGLARVVVVGHSMGGGHAFALQQAHPERCAGLALIDIGPDLEPEGRARSLRLSTERPASFSDADAAEAYLRETSPGYTDQVYADRVRWLFHRRDGALVWRSSPAALRQIFAAGAQPGAWAALASVPVPLLLVRGSRSTHLGRATAERMVRTAPRARLIELDAGHNVQLDQPAALAEAIVAFASEVAG